MWTDPAGAAAPRGSGHVGWTACQTGSMACTEALVPGRIDLRRTLAPLVRGNGDRTIRLASGRAAWATRTPAGPVTIAVTDGADHLLVEAWGPGADEALGRAEAILGLGPGDPATDDLRDAPHGIVTDLARRLPGIRIPRAVSVLDALVPAILEQKVTGAEAHRAWHGLVRELGEPAPGPVPGLRLGPSPAALARVPYYAFHPFGVERRRAELIRHVAATASRFEAITGLPGADARAALTREPGIGLWTAAEVAVRALGDPDAVSVGDFHLPNLVAWTLAGEPRGDDARMLELLAPYAGRRALVVRLLEASGLRAPRHGPRLAPRRIEAM